MRRKGRILLVLLNAGLAFYFLRGGQALGWLFVVSGLLLVYGAFRYGSVHSAFRAVRRGRLDAARAALQETDERYLDARSRAYASWVRAALAEADKDLSSALEHLEAARIDALSADDRAVLWITEAAIHKERGDRSALRAAIAEAHALKPGARAAQILRKAEKSLLASE